MTPQAPAAETIRPPAAEGTPQRLGGRAWKALEERLAALVDRANPILVKETRQALKSRQFVVTFLVVLTACWIVTFAGVAYVGPQIYYGAAGPQFLVAYYVILAFPLTLIVPYTAFRSLAAEQEENTYDLLSITTLGAQQIISGKLWSAFVQMGVYLCAVSPSIAFTFLLRGVDALTVGVLLGVAALASMGLSAGAVLVGAVARVRNTQVVVSVALVLALFWVFYGAYEFAADVTMRGPFFLRERRFWMQMAAVLTLYATSFGLIRAAAAAQIAFASENRSTPLRRWMALQQACLCGWIGGLAYLNWASPSVGAMVMVAAAAVALYWFFMGALMTGEWPHLSQRVQRSLPRTRLSRVFLSFFNPGPASGYLFAVANLTTAALAGGLLLWLGRATGAAWSYSDRAFYMLVLGWSYVTAFLGLGHLIINQLRRVAYVPLAAGFLTHLVLLLTGVGVPTVIQLTSQQLRNSGYSLVQVTNPIWTLGELMDRGPDAVEAGTLIWIVPTAALAALMLNMRSVAAELLHDRIAQPLRVAEDDAELRAAQRNEPANPWDADEAAQATARG